MRYTFFFFTHIFHDVSFSFNAQIKSRIYLVVGTVYYQLWRKYLGTSIWFTYLIIENYFKQANQIIAIKAFFFYINNFSVYFKLNVSFIHKLYRRNIIDNEFLRI